MMAVGMKLREFYFVFILISTFICLSLQEDGDRDDDGFDFGKIEKEKDVYILTQEIFDDFIHSRDTVLVKFYAPWCGHCKQLAPEYEKAADVLKISTPNVYLAKVDATVHTELAEMYEVNSYPTLYIFKKGVKMDYEGPREADGIIRYMKHVGSESFEMPKDATLILTSDNFTDVTKEEELMVVMFYAPWCGHCKKLKPEYEKVAKEMAKRKPPVLLAKVDATVEKDLAELYQVQGYPTLKFFRKGRAHPFKSDAREKWGLISYIEKHLGPASTEIKSLKDLKAKVNPTHAEAPYTVVGFFEAGSKLFTLYQEHANELRDDFTFVHTFDQSSASHWDIKMNTLAIFQSESLNTKYEEKIRKFKYQSDTTTEAVKNFIDKNKIPLMGELTAWSKDNLYKEKRPLVVFFYTVDWTFEHKEATQLWRKKFADIAHKHKSLTFVIADDEANRDLFTEFKFDDSGEEINIGILAAGDRKYPMDPMEEYDEEEVMEFISDFKQGFLKPIIKSQVVPTKQVGPVTVVVGKTFEQIVLDDKKDVLIEMYAPWCGHCKQLEPIYKELAKKLKSVKNLVIAKMDATANDAPLNFPVSGFPTIYFAPAGNKEEPIKFNEERNLEGFMKFLKENSTPSVKDEL